MGVIDLDARVKKLEQGGGAVGPELDQLEAAVTAIENELTVTKEPITPTTGEAGTGGCFYEIYGKLVHIHLNLTGLTATTTPSSPVYNNIYTLPETLTPAATVIAFGGSSTDPGTGTVRGMASSSNNRVTVVTDGTTALVDILYLLPTSESEAETTE